MLPVLPFRRDLQRLGHQPRRATRCSLRHRQQPTSSPHIAQLGPSKFLPRPTPRLSLTPHPSWTRSTAKNSSKTADGTNDQSHGAPSVSLTPLEEPMGVYETYTDDFKADALNLIRKGDRSICEIGRDLGVSHWVLRRWCK